MTEEEQDNWLSKVWKRSLGCSKPLLLGPAEDGSKDDPKGCLYIRFSVEEEEEDNWVSRVRRLY
jgi:hypothetical protein